MAIEHRAIERLSNVELHSFQSELRELCAKYRIHLDAVYGGGISAVLSNDPGFEEIENGDES